MKEKIYNLITTIAYLTYVLTALILFIFMPKYNIFFKGWWTLMLILPSLGNLLFQRNKLTSLFVLITGILINITLYNVIALNKCFIILLCLGIILIGIDIIRNTIKIPEKKESTSKDIPYYYVLFGGTEEKANSKFSGGRIKTIFGYINLDLRDSKIEDCSTIKVLTIFGESEIILPENVEVITTNNNILGGTENKHKSTNNKTKKNKVYIESTSILGSTKIK